MTFTLKRRDPDDPLFFSVAEHEGRPAYWLCAFMDAHTGDWCTLRSITSEDFVFDRIKRNTEDPTVEIRINRETRRNENGSLYLLERTIDHINGKEL